MEIRAIMLDAKDNVATLTEAARPGDTVRCIGGTGETLESRTDVPVWHKIALKPLSKGTAVLKYGESIGELKEDVEKGAWISHLNLKSVPRDYAGEYVKVE